MVPKQMTSKQFSILKNYVCWSGSIYNYEPFEYVGINRIYEDDIELALSAKNVINGLLYCNFSMVFNECKIFHENSYGILELSSGPESMKPVALPNGCV